MEDGVTVYKVSATIKDKYNLISIVLIVMILLTAIMFGFKKQGFYIDEYYVYTFANGTQVGIDIDSGKWNNTSRYLNQLVSEGDENFRFDTTYHNCENGVHPPMYYFLVHFVSSIFTGVFSKWIGLSINILLLIPILILVKRIVWILSGGDEIISLLTVALYGLSPITISMVMLTRMYLLMSLWVVLYVYIHVRNLDRGTLSIGRFLFPVFVCGFFGFLTQYFFVVIMFFITFVYAFYLLVFCRKIKDTLIYGTTALLSLIATYFVWPVSVFHIFKGHRGKGAFSQARDFSNMINRFTTHFQWMNELVFGKTVVFFILLLVIGLCIFASRYSRLRRSSQKYIITTLPTSIKGMLLLMISSVLSFLCLTQVALVDGITCSRQLYGVYSIFLLILPSATKKVLDCFTGTRTYISTAVTVMSILLVLVSGHFQKAVLFVYEDEKIAMDFARNHPDECVVMFHNDDGNYDSRIQEIIMYPEVFFALASDPTTVEDIKIACADEILVYITTAVSDPEECFKYIYKQNDNIHNADHLWDSSSGFFSVYLLH